MHKILNFIVEFWVRFLVGFLIGAIIMVIYNLINASWTSFINYCNGAFIGAFFLISIGILSVLNMFGAFDIFSFFALRKKKEDGMKENLYEYSTRKKEERTKYKLAFIPYIFWGFVFFVVSLIFYFLTIF